MKSMSRKKSLEEGWYQELISPLLDGDLLAFTNYESLEVVRGEFMVQAVIQKPYVCVRIIDNDGIDFYGFAKAMWPDKWSPDTGCKIAGKRAVRALVRRDMKCQS